MAANATSVQLMTEREVLTLTPAQAREAGSALHRFADLVDASVLKVQPESPKQSPSK